MGTCRLGLYDALNQNLLNVMNAQKSKTGLLHIGNFFITQLSQEDWDILCKNKKPYVLDNGTEIIYGDNIPAEMQSKYAEKIISEKPSLKEAQEKVTQLESQLWWAKADLNALTELQAAVIPKVRRMSQAEQEDMRRFDD